jgi:hypothetical protein
MQETVVGDLGISCVGLDYGLTSDGVRLTSR